MSSESSANIRQRLVAIIRHVIDDARRYKSLEEITHISAATWRGFWNRNGGASGEMIEAIGKNWPQFAFWLTTGVTDPSAGHIAPPGTENLVEAVNNETPEATAYFRHQIEWIDQERPSTHSWASELEDLLLAEEASTIISQNTSVSKSNSSDLLNLDLEWSKEFKEAKAIIKARQAEKKRNKLNELRQLKVDSSIKKA